MPLGLKIHIKNCYIILKQLIDDLITLYQSSKQISGMVLVEKKKIKEILQGLLEAKNQLKLLNFKKKSINEHNSADFASSTPTTMDQGSQRRFTSFMEKINFRSKSSGFGRMVDHKRCKSELLNTQNPLNTEFHQNEAMFSSKEKLNLKEYLSSRVAHSKSGGALSTQVLSPKYNPEHIFQKSTEKRKRGKNPSKLEKKLQKGKEKQKRKYRTTEASSQSSNHLKGFLSPGARPGLSKALQTHQSSATRLKQLRRRNSHSMKAPSKTANLRKLEEADPLANRILNKKRRSLLDYHTKPHTNCKNFANFKDMVGSENIDPNLRTLEHQRLGINTNLSRLLNKVQIEANYLTELSQGWRGAYKAFGSVSKTAKVLPPKHSKKGAGKRLLKGLKDKTEPNILMSKPKGLSKKAYLKSTPFKSKDVSGGFSGFCQPEYTLPVQRRRKSVSGLKVKVPLPKNAKHRENYLEKMKRAVRAGDGIKGSREARKEGGEGAGRHRNRLKEILELDVQISKIGKLIKGDSSMF